MALLNGAVDTPQTINVSNEEIARPVGESNGEKEDSALDLGTPVPRQDGILPRF